MSIFISFGLLIGIISLFVILFAPLVSNQFESIVSIDINHKVSTIEKSLDSLRNEHKENFVLDAESFLQTYGVINKEASLVTSLKNYVLNAEWLKSFEVNKIINTLLSFTGNIFVSVISVIFITFFLLYEKGSIRRYFLSLIPNRYFEVTIVAITKIEKMLSNYLLGIFLQMISIFTIASFGLILADVDYAITIAVFAAVVNLIPFLGPILGGIFGIIVGLSTTSDLATADAYALLIAEILTVFAVVQLIDNLFLQPIIFSRSVQAHPLEIFLIVFVGATIAGPVGMILAIPTYTIFRVSFSEFLKGYQQYQVFRSGRWR